MNSQPADYLWYGRIDDYSTEPWWGDPKYEWLLKEPHVILWERLRRSPGILELVEGVGELRQMPVPTPKARADNPALDELASHLKKSMQQLSPAAKQQIGLHEFEARVADARRSAPVTDHELPYCTLRRSLGDPAVDALEILLRHYNLDFAGLAAQDVAKRWTLNFSLLLDQVTTEGRYIPPVPDKACVNLLQAASPEEHANGDTVAGKYRLHPFRDRPKIAIRPKSGTACGEASSPLAAQSVSNAQLQLEFSLTSINLEYRESSDCVISLRNATAELGVLHYTPLLLAVDLRNPMEALLDCFEAILKKEKKRNAPDKSGPMRPTAKWFKPIEALDQYVRDPGSQTRPSTIIQSFEKSACLSFDPILRVVEEIIAAAG
jgi:hypothetical protein